MNTTSSLLDRLGSVRPEYAQLLESLDGDFCPSCGGEGCPRDIQPRRIRINAATLVEIECCAFEVVRLTTAATRQFQESSQEIANASSVPEIFRKARLVDLTETPTNRSAIKTASNFVAQFSAYREAGQGLTVIGGSGSGKTMLVSAILNSIIAAGGSGKYYFAPDLFAAFRPGEEKNEQLLIDELSRISLLVLDDVGAEKYSDWVESIYSRVIDVRYRNARPTIIASQYTGDQLKSRIGYRAIDRLIERNRVCKMGDESFRKNNARRDG